MGSARQGIGWSHQEGQGVGWRCTLRSRWHAYGISSPLLILLSLRHTPLCHGHRVFHSYFTFIRNIIRPCQTRGTYPLSHTVLISSPPLNFASSLTPASAFQCCDSQRCCRWNIPVPWLLIVSVSLCVIPAARPAPPATFPHLVKPPSSLLTSPPPAAAITISSSPV